jgi:HK97 gp10 family phage protein
MTKWNGIEQLDDLKAKLQALPQYLGQTVVDRVKPRTPVRTGALQRDWQYEVEGPMLTVGNTMEYASFVELGTVKMRPVAMLQTTLMEVPQIVTSYLER